MKTIPADIHWLPNEEYHIAVMQLQRQVGAVLSPFHVHGLGVFVPGAIKEIVTLCEDFGLRVRGVDKAISLELIRNKNGGLIQEERDR